MAESKAREFAKIGSLALTAGNLPVADGSDWGALSVGSDGQVIRADSAEADGIAWKHDGTLIATFNTTGSGTLGETVSIPAGCNRILVAFSEVDWSSATRIMVELGDSSGYSADSGGGFNTVLTSTCAAASFSGGPWKIYGSGSANENVTGFAEFYRVPSTNRWIGAGVACSASGTRANKAAGYIDNATEEVDRLRITLEGAGVFNDGEVKVFVWT